MFWPSASKFFQNFQSRGVLTSYCHSVSTLLLPKFHSWDLMSKKCAYFKPKFDFHQLCRLCRPCNRQCTCKICASWPETYWAKWAYINLLEKRSKAAKQGKHCLPPLPKCRPLRQATVRSATTLGLPSLTLPAKHPGLSVISGWIPSWPYVLGHRYLQEWPQQHSG